MNKIKTIDFFGLKISSFESEDLKSFIVETIKTNQKKILYGYSFGILPYFKKYPEIVIHSNQFDISVMDGRGLYLLAKILGFPVKSDLSIPNMTKMTLELADEYGFSVMIIGSSPENNLKATENARKKYPGALVHDGHHGGWFTPEDQLISVSKINDVKPDILLVGVSSPKKETFVANWKEELNVKVMIPFGGAIDILSGKSKPIPKVVKKLALGALFRWFQEPRRLFRDSIIHTTSVLFRLIPTIFYNKYILKRKEFSIPEFYSKGIVAPISGFDAK